jgi:hypothetical protein
MNVFVLGTGRCGTVSFIEACRYIDNYSAAHESLSRKQGGGRLDYPDNHIEADNRLSWFLGGLAERFKDQVIYVLLTRDRDMIARSYSRRFDETSSMIDAFNEGIKLTSTKILNEDERLQSCYDYVDAIHQNINLLFSTTEAPTTVIHLESIKEDFKKFWTLIDAEGDLESALEVFDTPRNISRVKKNELNYYR